MITDNETIDEILANIAVRIQLPPSTYQKAIERYNTIADYIDRPTSSLNDNVNEVYTQGSIAIGATIRSLKSQSDDLYDVDIIAEINGRNDSTPTEILDELYHSVNGEKGSRYHGRTIRQTRCVTVQYGDMHIDITPMVRVSSTHQALERAGKISHSSTESPRVEYFAENNSYGLAEYINTRVPQTRVFSERFAKRATAYDQELLLEKAEVQPAPDQTEVQEKSITIVALQLIKRHLQILWSDNESRKGFRKPPTVILSRLVSDFGLGDGSLSNEVICLANRLSDKFSSTEKVVVTNPSYEKDELTDRWPESHRIAEDQKIFSSDMRNLASLLMKAQSMSLGEKRKILENLFGESILGQAYQEFYKRQGFETKNDALNTVPKKGAISIIGASGSHHKSSIKPPSTTSWSSD